MPGVLDVVALVQFHRDGIDQAGQQQRHLRVVAVQVVSDPGDDAAVAPTYADDLPGSDGISQSASYNPAHSH